MFKCSFCDRLFPTRAGRSIHYLTCSSNPDRNLGYILSKRQSALSRPPRTWTDAQRAQHRVIMREAVKRHPESYLGRWRRQSVVYKGIVYDSSWEVLAKKYFDRFKIKAIRKFKRTFSYHWNGSYRVYKPDFFLPEYRLYVEVKGMVTDRDIAKWKQFSVDRRLLVLTGKSIRRIKAGSALGLKSKIKNNPDAVLLDGLPIDYELLSVKNVLALSKKDRLSREERGEIVREAFRRSTKMRDRRRSSEHRKALRELEKHRSYAGERNSQYGSFWINDGNTARKWHADLGPLPIGFSPGRRLYPSS